MDEQLSRPCQNRNCKKTMTETSREYVGRNFFTRNKVYRIYYECPDGHTFNEKVDIDGTANDPD